LFHGGKGKKNKLNGQGKEEKKASPPPPLRMERGVKCTFCWEVIGGLALERMCNLLGSR